MRKIFLTLTVLVMTTLAVEAQSNGNYATVNGMKMYYELHGKGFPLVLLHGGGSTIQTSFGRILPLLARNHQVIAIELQAHGHTADRGTPTTFKQDADDVAELLRQLKISNADFFGFSNGGQTSLQIALSYPGLVHKLVFASMFYSRVAVPERFWEGMKHATFSDLPEPYKVAFRKINPDSAALMTMFIRDSYRMQHFEGWTAEQVKSVTAPVFLVAADHDVMTPEHVVEMSRLLPHNTLVILPGGHGGYMGEIASATPGSKVPELFVGMLEEFLSAPMPGAGTQK